MVRRILSIQDISSSSTGGKGFGRSEGSRSQGGVQAAGVVRQFRGLILSYHIAYIYIYIHMCVCIHTYTCTENTYFM